MSLYFYLKKYLNKLKQHLNIMSSKKEEKTSTNKLHPSHVTRFSDASSFDEICTLCGATDQVPGGWGKLAEPCPKSENKKE